MRTRDEGAGNATFERRVVGRLISFVFACGGLAALWFGAGELVDGRASAGWPTTEGTIVKSYVEQHGDDDEKAFFAHVRYTYIVDGVEHFGDRIAFTSWNLGDAQARAKVATYPVGAVATVHFDPGDPTNAVLEPGVRAGAWGMVAFGAVFLALGAVLPLLIGRRPGARVQQS